MLRGNDNYRDDPDPTFGPMLMFGLGGVCKSEGCEVCHCPCDERTGDDKGSTYPLLAGRGVQAFGY